MKEKLYIFGARGMALVVAETANLLGYDVLGFVDDTSSAPIDVDGVEVISSLPPPSDSFKIIVAIGDCDARYSIAEQLATEGYNFATIVHPSASISNSVRLSKGIFIEAGVILDPHVTIGDYTIINKNTVVSHGTSIGKACHLAPSSVVAGDCNLGDAVWVGLGALVIEKRNIGSRTFIGAGAVVVHDTNINTLVYGIPAKEIKIR